MTAFGATVVSGPLCLRIITAPVAARTSIPGW
jgi:hypothetical protein